MCSFIVDCEQSFFFFSFSHGIVHGHARNDMKEKDLFSCL